ncbi:MAG TPA: hypothetical protein VG389_21685 [Myxococcota bacterium]|nr:hypothetical protein [Myxococcota bacterium]
MRGRSWAAAAVAALLGVAAVTATVRDAAAGGDLEWPSRRALKSGSYFYYPDGVMLASGTSYLYYATGTMMRSGTTYLYYPSGVMLRSGGDVYTPDGARAYEGWAGRLVDLSDGGTTLVVQRASDDSPLQVNITVVGDGYQLEHMEFGDRHGTRLWAIGRWITVDGDVGLFAEAAAAGGSGSGSGGGGARPGAGGGGGDEGTASGGGAGLRRLCGYDFDAVDWARPADNEEVLLDRKGQLWLVALDTCHGGLLAGSVDSFVNVDGMTMYLLDDHRAWLVASGSYFFLGKGVADIKGGSGTFSTKLKGEGWYRFDDVALVKGWLRATDGTLGREVWFQPKETFHTTF